MGIPVFDLAVLKFQRRSRNTFAEFDSQAHSVSSAAFSCTYIMMGFLSRISALRKLRMTFRKIETIRGRTLHVLFIDHPA
ncbi:MAG: hypothetical protein XD58_1588 [Thermotoga sp. 50_1627]|nr:MAG: hypothetical protein XD45_1654 [Thermotoga sp. 50_64]KUK24411.1 MAG: hypothetical protein XD58_1588 [Thermotoga sp. 50_1627]MDK2923553.1 hypothetical protein [Pseudothermotoga sp.]